MARLLTALLLLLFCNVHQTVLADSNNNDKAACPSRCRCAGDDNLRVDCSRRMLLRPPVTSIPTLTLDLSGNMFGPIINATLTRMSNLTDLDLSHNGIRRLLACTFNGLLSLRRVSLRGNLLSTLPDSLFTDGNGVERLDLSANLFAVLPDHVFRNTPKLKWLDLSHNRALELKLGTRFQVPRHLEYLDLSYNLFESVNVDSFHEAQNWEVGIDRTLKLSYCRIATIQPGSLIKIPHLKDLDLSGNAGIPAENLTAAIKEFERTRLQKLSLAHMNLTDIQAFFTQITLLAIKFVNVSHNQITSIPSGMFSTVHSLQVLDLSHNRLTSLGEGIKDLSNLRVLNLSSNALVSFKGQAPNSLSMVHDLDLSNNRLSSTNEVKLSPLIKLKRLKVKNNLLPSVLLPRSTNNLVEIDYSSNAIRSFNGFQNVPKLEVFDISDNDLEKVSEFLFKNALFIKVANFSRNSITDIDPRAFLPQAPLVLDLSHNFLTKVQYSNWLATQEMYLGHNNLVDVDMQTFHRMVGLRVLDLSANNLTNLNEDLLVHTSAMEHLDLSQNHLDQAYFAMLFRHLRHLLTLDLGSNNITVLNESMLVPLPDLQRLSVRDNQLQIIMPRVFRDLRHIKKIDLSGNPFSCVCDMLALRDWLTRTQILITGLYNVNSTAYHCQGPASRRGFHVMKWEPGQFECDEIMLYMIVFGAIGVTLIIAGVVSTVAHRLYKRHRRLKKERAKRNARLGLTVDADDLKKSAGKNNNSKRMTGEEIAEEIRNSIERREMKSMKEVERRERAGNGYVPWPASKRAGEKTKDTRVVPNESATKMEKSRERVPDRHYDHLTRVDGGMMEFVDRERDKRERTRYGQGDLGRGDRRREHGGEYVDIDDGIVRLRYDKTAPAQSYRRAPERGHFPGQGRTYRAEPWRRGDPYATAPSPSAAPNRNRWDTAEVWDREAGRWLMPGYRRSRSQGQRRDRSEQRYLTMPVRDQDYYHHHHHQHQGRGNDYEAGPRPAMYPNHYTNEVRFGIEDLRRYPEEQHQQRRSRRDMYEDQSRSYHQIPSEQQINVEQGRVSPRQLREPKEMHFDERQYTTDDDRRPLIRKRAKSQPTLSYRKASEWL